MALSADQRKKINKSDFVFPAKAPGPGSYPIDTLARARSALQLVGANGSEEEKKSVRAAVFAKYPQLKDNSQMNDALRKASGRRGGSSNG